MSEPPEAVVINVSLAQRTMEGRTLAEHGFSLVSYIELQPCNKYVSYVILAADRNVAAGDRREELQASPPPPRM